MRSVTVFTKEYANGVEVCIAKSWAGTYVKVVENHEIKEYIGFLRRLYAAAGIHMEVVNAIS